MDTLTHDEFKAMCKWFYECGEDKISFEISWKEFVKQATGNYPIETTKQD